MYCQMDARTSTTKMKKAVSMQFAVAFILFVIIMILILVYATGVFDVMKSKYSQYTCKASIKAVQAASLQKGQYDIKCPTLYETIPEAGGSEKERKERYMAEIAERMAYTWNLFGEGNYNLFTVGATGDEKFCIISHRLDFEEGIEIQNGNFWAYLGKNTAEIDKMKRTYLEYLRPPEFQGFDLKMPAQVPPLSTGTPVAIVFSYSKLSWLLQLTGDYAWGKASGINIPRLVLSRFDLGQAVTLDDRNFDSMVLVVPFDAENLKQLGCTNLPAEQEKIKKGVGE